MLTIQDRIEQFKRDCRSNEYYKKAVLDCDERIEEIDVILTGLACPNGYDSPRCENARNPYKSNKIEYFLKQDQIVAERKGYLTRINEINSVLMNIVDPIERQMVIELYVEQKACKYVASKYHFNDHSAMYKRVNAILKATFISLGHNVTVKT